ncbi:conserved hypothetical protein part 2, authentic frameshift [Pyrobaculum aerophilum str. IM2]|uniref:Uncharacterized protein n=1 Tax=Pyrobaculum aerophilum (strain ATCC 51768 / DSM 7523 / JCM 9630 / CIP 104966 / NBRC 100827 / IM2) TaxID=178306 RepID=Q8ZT47_PYRAE|nr:conserved hypothetical protein part 2, authentic frameshift [Pyrobaculum aerophilum str. IM2]
MIITSEPLDEGPWEPIPNNTIIEITENSLKMEILNPPS